MYGEKVMESNYQLSRIHNYVTGLMSEEEMYAIEREALDDPFLQDAIDGYKLQKGVDSRPLSLLQQRLARRIEERAEHKSRVFYSWQRLAIGSVAGVLFVVVCLLLFFNQLNRSREVKSQEVVLMEETLRVQTTVNADNDAKPEQGWAQFNEELNSELRDVADGGSLAIRFQLVGGVVKGLEISGDSTPELLETLSNFIRHKVRWEGTLGELNIEFKQSIINERGS